MSMIMQYVRIRETELTRLRTLLTAQPNRAYDYVDELADEDGDDVPAVLSRSIDTDKAWAGHDFLLHRAGAPVDVVHGGLRLTDDEWGYEPPRYLSPSEVATAAAFLAGTPFTALEPHFDPPAMVGVYPEIWDEGLGALEYLRSWYEPLAAFLGHAATDGDGVIVFLS
jgi:hypothetical protein